MAQAPSRCINHPDRTAVARCKQCHKPLCQRCVQKMPGGIYCSQACYEKMGSFQKRVEEIDKRPKAKLSLGGIIGRAIGPIIVIAILYYLFVNKGVRSVDGLINVVKGLIP